VAATAYGSVVALYYLHEWARFLLENPIFSQLARKVNAIYGIKTFITIFITRPYPETEDFFHVLIHYFYK
jgi:hypothetical protein